jgi:quercetin dioxygenase-like cupin family protein
MWRFQSSCGGVLLGLMALPCAVAGGPADHADPAALAAAAPAAAHAITPLKDAPFSQDEDVKCLESALETGNPDTGPSTFLLKAPAGCRVPAHYHSAQEQLIVVRGSVATGMKGMRSVTLTAGGFAVMPGKAVHWFSCEGKNPCLMVVTFDQKYDIVWVDAHSKP